ncbi:hypothetical protein ACFYN5_06695 [Streptomyces sp. NPDC007126]|uniref:Uncharacterized protein n=1 Tax=Streptomyces salinarius TaxID=2762598 RepID=A0ABW8B522_9ACTN|nr:MULTISPECIES: hypothetical protein [unclassified Streptomyces]QUW95623.1 hypothetical protein KE639_06893 [Streptomyces sp. V17-9]WKX23297.1 hypothetical protein Q3Y68_02200 [Streptomyces sp. HUAS CX7]
MSHNGEHDHKQPETAVEEVLREIEEARPRDAESDEGEHRGEAGDATSPNTGAQEDVEGE